MATNTQNFKRFKSVIEFGRKLQESKDSIEGVITDHEKLPKKTWENESEFHAREIRKYAEERLK